MKNKRKKAIPILLAGGMLLSSGAMVANTASASTFDYSEDSQTLKSYELSKADREKAERIGSLPLANAKNLKETDKQEAGKIGIALRVIKEGVQKGWNKLPDSIKNYVKIDSFMKALDTYFEISDSVEDLIYRSLRYVAPSWIGDSVIWFATKTLMLFIPI